MGVPFLRLVVREPLNVVVLQRLAALGALDLVPEAAVEVGADRSRDADETGRWLVAARLGDGRRRELAHGLRVSADDALAVAAEHVWEPALVGDDDGGGRGGDLVSLSESDKVLAELAVARGQCSDNIPEVVRGKGRGDACWCCRRGAP